VFSPGFGEGFRLHGFRYALHHNLNAVHPVCTFCDGVSHGFNVSIHGIIEHQNFCHFASLLVCFLTADRCVPLKICHHGQTAKMNAIYLIYNNMKQRLCSKMKQLSGRIFEMIRKAYELPPRHLTRKTEIMLQDITFGLPDSSFH
jgi:hypothetical protein